jgi:hypothetical protein
MHVQYRLFRVIFLDSNVNSRWCYTFPVLCLETEQFDQPPALLSISPISESAVVIWVRPVFTPCQSGSIEWIFASNISQSKVPVEANTVATQNSSDVGPCRHHCSVQRLLWIIDRSLIPKSQ